MDILAKPDTPGSIISKLDQLATYKTDTFYAALGRIKRLNASRLMIVKHVLSWVLYAVRPITVDEVRHALAIDCEAGSFDDANIIPEYQVTSFCAGIVVIDQTRILRLVDESVLEHIRDSSILLEDPHGEISLQCLTYLTMENFLEKNPSTTDREIWTKKYPLVQYAADNWMTHHRRANQKHLVESKALALLQRETGINFPLRSRDIGFARAIGGLHACVYFDQIQWAEKLCRDGFPVDYVDESGQTALHWAAFMNRESIVSLLIRSDARKNATDKQNNTPLHLAIFGNHEAVVRRLLQAGVDPGIYNKQNFTPLRWAIKYNCRAVAMLLARSEAEVDVEDRDGWTPLRWAIWQ